MTKNFDDFRGGFQALDFELLAKKLNDQELTTAIPNTPENTNKFITSMQAQNITVIFELLEAYHLWLNKPENKD